MRLDDQHAYALETWHTTLWTNGLQSFINGGPGLTLTYFTTRLYLVAFVIEMAQYDHRYM